MQKILASCLTKLMLSNMVYKRCECGTSFIWGAMVCSQHSMNHPMAQQASWYSHSMFLINLLSAGQAPRAFVVAYLQPEQSNSMQSSFLHNTFASDGSERQEAPAVHASSQAEMQLSSQQAVAPDMSLTAPDRATMEGAVQHNRLLVQCWGSALSGIHVHLLYLGGKRSIAQSFKKERIACLSHFDYTPSHSLYKSFHKGEVCFGALIPKSCPNS